MRGAVVGGERAAAAVAVVADALGVGLCFPVGEEYVRIVFGEGGKKRG